jgi:hypothetical protein
MDELLTTEQKEHFRIEQTRLIKLIEALNNLEKNKDWKTLKEIMFETSLARIERLLINESLKQTIDPPIMYRLQGEWLASKQFVDIKAFADQLVKQLEIIKQKLK